MRKPISRLTLNTKFTGFLAAAILMTGSSTASGQSIRSSVPELPVLTQTGPWPVISQMAFFRDRLWFTNSVKGVDHNSAEIYSYNPATQETRYERHLWSQDAGNPFVSNGLLYWPSEDPRLSPGWGDFQVTNGEDWATGQITTARMFHVFAMAELKGQLVAATSAWRAGLQVSSDHGRTWRQAYDHPTPDRRVSRIVDLVEVGGFLVGHLRGPEGRKMVRFDGTRVSDLPDWPRDLPMSEVVRHGNEVYGIIRREDGAAVWRSNGARSEAITENRPGWRPFDRASDGSRLWAISDSASGGQLWRSENGTDWTLAGNLPGGEPFDVIASADRVYIGGAGADGQGILWGFQHGTATSGDREITPLPKLDPKPKKRITDWLARAQVLDEALRDPQNYAVFGRPIRDLAYDAAASSPPKDFFNRLLETPRPEGRMNPFRDVVVEPAGDIGASITLWAMGVSGQGRVPPDMIAAPWTKAENGAAKYFDPQQAAMWAAAELAQKDTETIDALISRLVQPNDPLWLKGDAIGALSILTGQRFGFDLQNWQSWWQQVRPDWQKS